MADKPKKAKGKLVGKKKAVKKAKPSAAPIEQGSGLNVESKPKAPVGFTGTYEHEPRAFRPLKPEGIGPSDKSIREAVIAVGKRRGVNANEALWQAENLAPQGKSIIHGAKGIHPDNFFLGREPQQGSAPAFGPRNTTKNPVESLRKGTKDDLVKMRTSKAKEAPSFQGAMKTGKERKAANKNLLEGMAKGARDFPGPKDEKKQMAAMDMTSKMAKAGKEVRDAQEKDTKKKARLKELGKYVQREVFNKGANAETDREAKIKRHKEYAAEQSAQPHTPAPAFGARPMSDHEKANLHDSNKISGLGAFKYRGNISSREDYDKQKAYAKKKAASNPNTKNPYSGRSKTSSQAKHQSKGFASQDKKDAWAKSLGEGPALPKRESDFLGNTGKAFRNDGSQNSPAHKGGHARDRRLTVGESASAFKKGAATPQSSSPSLASKAGGAIKGADTHPTITGFLKATGVHLGMAAMHGTNYPRVMAQHASQGPREFKPGWHGFTSPVERPKAEEGTDTKGERA